MPSSRSWRLVDQDLFLYADTCNVYLLRQGESAVVVDFGSGTWVGALPEIGVRRIEHVVLTHAHRDQCHGLYRGRHPGCPVHVPQGDAHLLDAVGLERFWSAYQTAGCPASYAAPRLPVDAVQADLAADTETRFGPVRLCAVATPGHTQGALTYLVEWHGRHLAFCGDAARANGALHEPYHLEWDHWTPSGALQAWHGLERLGYCYFDLLLPSHGPVVARQARACVRQTQQRIMALVRSKGSVCAGERNRWVDLEPLACGASRVLPHLYQFGANSFLLVSDSGDGLVVDPQLADLDRLEPLRQEIGLERVSAGTSSHYHLDHSDGLGLLRDRYGARVWLHPWVAEPIRDRDRYDVPWLPSASVVADRLLPEQGRFRWQEYAFTIRPLPAQTWWHCAFGATVDGQQVLFSGDNFQPPSRWNGTGGFCAYNVGRFREGFAASARAVLDWAPDLICNGHGCVYRFAPSHYRRIVRWAGRAEQAVRALCASASWLAEYDCHATRWEPFVSRARPGQTVELAVVRRNHGRRAEALSVRPVGPPGWDAEPAARRIRVPVGVVRRSGFRLQVAPQAETGRHLVAADVVRDGRPLGEVCVAIVDVV